MTVQDTKKGFLVYYDYKEHLALLSAEERGNLLMAILEYGENGTLPEFDGALGMAFSFIRAQMDRDAAKYEKTCEKRRAGGQKGGRPPKASKGEGKQDEPKGSFENQKETEKPKGSFENQEVFSKPDTDTETETDKETDTDTETDTTPPTPPGEVKAAEPPEDPPKEPEPDPVPYGEIVELYHSICKSYPKLRTVTANRKKHIASRWKEYPDLGTFRELFQKAEDSAFLKGESDGGWSATFDWMMLPTNMAKVLEGNFSNKPTKGGQPHGDYSGANQRPASQPTLTGFHMAE